jgi:hypothetical protein
LKLRRRDSSREFLYTQLFAGLAYLVAGAIIVELWRVNRKSKFKALPQHDEDVAEVINCTPDSLKTPIILDKQKKSERINE